MTYIFIAAVALALWHFIYEGMVAPSLRMHLRYRLFALRDRLRAAKAFEAESVPDDAFQIMEDSLRNAIRLLPRTNLDMLRRARQYLQDNPEVAAAIAKRQETVRACANDEIAGIDRALKSSGVSALTVNSAGWAIYVVPLLAAVLCVSSVIRYLTQSFLLPTDKITGFEKGLVATV